MEHYFLLPVTHLDVPLELRARLQTFGYTYKYFVMAGNRELVFERSDSGSEFRMLETQESSDETDNAQLARDIIVALQSLNK